MKNLYMFLLSAASLFVAATAATSNIIARRIEIAVM